MKPTDLALPMETQLGQELYDRLEGDMIEMIIKEAKVEHIENDWKMILEGHSYRISKELTPEIHSLCMEVKEKLNYEKQIDFYITNSSDFNAYAIPSTEEMSNDVINLNSMLVERLTNEELRFVIGHEIGHLASKNARINQLIQFVFPNQERIPMILMNKINLWEKLAELTADRYGFIASENFSTCLKGFFKMSSGLNVERLNIQEDALLEENERRIEFFKNGEGLNITTHPVNPIRIKALQLFSQSGLYGQIQSGKEEITADEILDEKISELAGILTILSSSELDYHRKQFIASAGIIMATLDGSVGQEEHQNTLAVLANLTIFPESYLDDMIKTGKVNDIFFESMQKIIQANPGERMQMISYMLDSILADHQILPGEVEFIYEIGEKFMGFARKEIAQIMAQKIQERFFPKVY